MHLYIYLLRRRTKRLVVAGGMQRHTIVHRSVYLYPSIHINLNLNRDQISRGMCCLRHAGAPAWRRGPVCACTHVCWCRRIFTYIHTSLYSSGVLLHLLRYPTKVFFVPCWQQLYNILHRPVYLYPSCRCSCAGGGGYTHKKKSRTHTNTQQEQTHTTHDTTRTTQPTTTQRTTTPRTKTIQI